MFVLINGAFGIGKTVVARELRRRLPRSVIVDPEHIGIVLMRLPGYHRSDFQHLPLWRKLTIGYARAAARLYRTVIIPMAFSEPAYLDEIRTGLAAAGGAPVLHLCLTAPLTVVRERLAGRGEPHGTGRWSWVHRRAEECCAAHQRPEFAVHVPTDGRSPEEIVSALLPLIADADR